MNKVKLFIENFFVYGISGIISSIIPVIMVPIITRIIPSSEYYGINDLAYTVTQFGSAIALMGMYDAMYRMFFEKEDERYKKTVCSTALAFTIFTSVAVFIILLLFRKLIAQCFLGSRRYERIICISALGTLIGATNSIVSAPTRMQNKRKVYVITSTISPILSYSISIPLLLAGHYIIALPLASVLSSLIMEVVFGIMNHKWFQFERFDKVILKEMLQIGIPLLPNFLIYWVFNSFDKVMITNFIGIGEEGIYSIGAKLGSISQLIYIAFAGGWQFFALSTMKESNQVKSNSMVFEYLSILSFAATSLICAFSFPLFQLLFPQQYIGGYIVAPYLFLTPLLQMLFQVSASQFLVVKKTWPNMFILLSGAVFNVIGNYFLIPLMGIEGAALATLMGYVVSDVVCVFVLKKMNLIVLQEKYFFIVLLMILYMITWRLFASENALLGVSMSIMFSLLIFRIYKQEFCNIIKYSQ